MISIKVYVHVRHWTFWYGVYGLDDKSWNDEITIYADPEMNQLLGYYDLMTGQGLNQLINGDDLDPVDDADYIKEIRSFLDGDSDIAYSYIYPRDKSDLVHQVNHFAPVNDNGHKPIYIRMWSKQAAAWDIEEIKKATKVLGHEFLHEEIDEIEIPDQPTYEETKRSYDEDFAPYMNMEPVPFNGVLVKRGKRMLQTMIFVYLIIEMFGAGQDLFTGELHLKHWGNVPFLISLILCRIAYSYRWAAYLLMLLLAVDLSGLTGYLLEQAGILNGLHASWIIAGALIVAIAAGMRLRSSDSFRTFMNFQRFRRLQ
ncbi:hypothetical protein [Paenibacillus glycanilyticus]|uniref:Uncharacterized protein n=1 Tax=Paenibacillus glycanilyticus TaxID=126569 RepID=A0ABQ6GD52_9BACL|nr:hypothetical protein [Paenibacillus glycanilyticus]GLX68183.1 hypothetical protein MU1_25280 [Paenibacillus glycanilyticus]